MIYSESTAQGICFDGSLAMLTNKNKITLPVRRKNKKKKTVSSTTNTVHLMVEFQ